MVDKDPKIVLIDIGEHIQVIAHLFSKPLYKIKNSPV
jgi:hypothetical protein